jgi:putative salt-induced outer membrane protein
MFKSVSFFLLVTTSLISSADWDSEVELGAVMTSGNTDQQTLKFRFDSTRDGERYVNTGHAEALSASEDGNETAEKYYLHYRIARKLDDDRSLFSRIGYEEDKFSGFDRQVDLTAGYSHRLMNRENMKLNADFGVGARSNKLDTGDSQTEAIARIAGLYEWQVSDNALFKQFIGFEVGEDLTTSRSETSLESTISGNLAMKLAVKVKNNSDVPVGKKKTDTESTVTLVYKF